MTFIEFKNAYFGGDEDLALKTLAHEGYTHEFKVIKNIKEYEEIMKCLDTKELARKYYDYIEIEIKENPSILNKIYKVAKSAITLNITEEDLENPKKNPFKAKMLKAFLGMLITGTFIFLGGFFSGQLDPNFLNSLEIVLPAVETYFVSDLGFNIIKYLKYKKILKQINEDLIERTDENDFYHEEGGKTL